LLTDKNRVESLLARTWKSRRIHPAKSLHFRLPKVEPLQDSQIIIKHQDPPQCILQDRHLVSLIFVFVYKINCFLMFHNKL